ncbi:MAG: arylformamidase [Bacteroidia bacterium]
MKAQFEIGGKWVKVNLDEGVDLSIPVSTNPDQVNAYYAHPVKMEPYKSGDFVGEVKQGGSVNYRDISFNPHGNGTHTECVGHITEDIHSVNEHFKDFWQLVKLVSIEPISTEEGDLVIDYGDVASLLTGGEPAIIIRTLPNPTDKVNRQYSGLNPPYLSDSLIKQLVDAGIKHLLVDLPSVDREVDNGKLLGHRAFWMPNGELRMDCTITEMVFVPSELEDGTYLLNLQVAPFENDAAPSRPLIYPIEA